jgi:hypothetical protein
MIAQGRYQGWNFFLRALNLGFISKEITVEFSRYLVASRYGARQTINPEKVMVAVIWSLLGFPGLERFAKRKTFTSNDFCEAFCP